MDLSRLSGRGLAAAIRRRWDINHTWVNVYWAEFIPCVCGIPDAVALIRTGDLLAVDGYPGVVAVGTGESCEGIHSRMAWWASLRPLSSKRERILTQRISLSTCAKKSSRWG